MAFFGPQSRFMSPALHAFPPVAIREFFSSIGVETCVEPDGCVFPVSQKAADVAQALERAARAHGSDLRCGTRATRLVVEPADDGDGAALRVTGVETTQGLLHARRVILATGGQSYPALGSDGSGFALAQAAGLALTTPVPALAGLVTQENWPGTLAGVVLEKGGLRLDVKGASKQLLAGPVLLTHKGLSGPPALALSGEIAARLLTTSSVPVRVSFIADRSAADWLALFESWRQRHGGRALHNLLAGEVPRGLAAALCGLSDAAETAVARAKRSTLEALASSCSDLQLHCVGTEGWGRAMATRGGVALSELNPKTLSCRRVKGLYCAGEVMDLDGPCGGYNLTWAFASGRLAGAG